MWELSEGDTSFLCIMKLSWCHQKIYEASFVCSSWRCSLKVLTLFILTLFTDKHVLVNSSFRLLTVYKYKVRARIDFVGMCGRMGMYS